MAAVSSQDKWRGSRLRIRVPVDVELARVICCCYQLHSINDYAMGSVAVVDVRAVLRR